MSTTGPKIRKGRGSSVPFLPPDDPIYSRGFAIGVVRLTDSSKSTRAKTSPSSTTSPASSTSPQQPEPAADSTPPA